MNRINPALFAAWVRESLPGQTDRVAIDGKTSCRSQDRNADAAPLHLVSAFAGTARLVLAEEAVPDKGSEPAAIPVLLERLGAEAGLKGALVSIDATNSGIAREIIAQGADDLLAVKANQPRLRAGVEVAFAAALAGTPERCASLDKGPGRIDDRHMAVLRQTGWIEGARRFPGESRLPKAACLLCAGTRVGSKGATRTRARYLISSRALPSVDAAVADRGHWAIGNRLPLTLDVIFADDQSRIRRGHGAQNMATVRHVALNLRRTAKDKRSVKSRGKIAARDTNFLEALITSKPD